MAYKLIKGVKSYRKKNKTFYKLHAIYLLPIIFVHELLHAIAAILLNVKILEFKIFKNDILYNGYVKTKIPNKKWKQIIISYAPYLLLIPFFMIFISKIMFFVAIYLITTITIFNNKKIYIFFPSKSDLDLVKKYEYNKYLEKELGNNFYKLNFLEIKQEIDKKNLLTYKKFKQIKKKSI